MNGRWVPGNRFTLLENGEEFYPRAFEVIAAARKEVILETFILFDDPVGRQLQAALLEAAGRGTQVDVTVDALQIERAMHRVGELGRVDRHTAAALALRVRVAVTRHAIIIAGCRSGLGRSF